MKYPVVDHIRGHIAQVGPIPVIPPQEYNKGILKNPNQQRELKMQPATVRTKEEIFNNHYGLIDKTTGDFKNRMQNIPSQVFDELDKLEARGFQRNVILSLRRKLKLGDLTTLNIIEKSIFDNIIKQLSVLPGMPGSSAKKKDEVERPGQALPPGFREMGIKEEEEKYPEEDVDDDASLGLPVSGADIAFDKKAMDWSDYVKREMHLLDSDDRDDKYSELMQELEDLEAAGELTPDETQKLYIILDNIYEEPDDPDDPDDPLTKEDIKNIMIDLTDKTLKVIRSKDVSFEEARQGMLNTVKQLNAAVSANTLTREEGNELVNKLLSAADKMRRREIPVSDDDDPEKIDDDFDEELKSIVAHAKDTFKGLNEAELKDALNTGIEYFIDETKKGNYSDAELEIIIGALDLEHENAVAAIKKPTAAKPTKPTKEEKILKGKAALAASVALWKKDITEHGMTEDNEKIGTRILHVIKKGRKNNTLSKRDGTELMSVIRKARAMAESTRESKVVRKKTKTVKTSIAKVQTRKPAAKPAKKPAAKPAKKPADKKPKAPVLVEEVVGDVDIPEVLTKPILVGMTPKDKKVIFDILFDEWSEKNQRQAQIENKKEFSKRKFITGVKGTKTVTYDYATRVIKAGSHTLDTRTLKLARV
jgi:hypothetical protein